jgi:hypothetical protein
MINTWNIKFKQTEVNNQNIDTIIKTYFNDATSCTFLLNTNKNKYSLLEKIVNDIAMFHFNRLNIKYDENTHYVEFWLKSKYQSTIHIDSDEYSRDVDTDFSYENGPLLSSIVYMNDSPIPTIITDINHNDYITNKYNNQNKITISFPKYLKHISFNGNYYHGALNLFKNMPSDNLSRYILAINLWAKKPKRVPYFDIDIFQFMKHKNNKLPILDCEIENNDDFIEFEETPSVKYINTHLINVDFFKKIISSNGNIGNGYMHQHSHIQTNNDYELFEFSTIPDELLWVNDTKIERKYYDHIMCNCLSNEQIYIKQSVANKAMQLFISNTLDKFAGFSSKNLKIIKHYKYDIQSQELLNTSVIILLTDTTCKLIYKDGDTITVGRGDLFSYNSKNVERIEYGCFPCYILSVQIYLDTEKMKTNFVE